MDNEAREIQFSLQLLMTSAIFCWHEDNGRELPNYSQQLFREIWDGVLPIFLADRASGSEEKTRQFISDYLEKLYG